MNDEQRRLLYDGLVAGLGQEVAGVLMEHLPPAGWSDLARRQDIDLLRADIARDMATLTAALRGEMASLSRTLIIAMVTTVSVTVAAISAFGGIAFALR